MASHLQFDAKFLIYRFHNGLGTLYDSYVSQYNHTHDALEGDGKAAFTLEYAIRRFLNTCKKPTNNASEDGAGFSCLGKYKTARYGHCKKPRHVEEKFWVKYPHLKPDDSRRCGCHSNNAIATE